MAPSNVKREDSPRRERTTGATSLEEKMAKYAESIHHRPGFADGCAEEHHNDDDADCYCE